MRTEELAFVLKCHSALGTSLDMERMTAHFVAEVVRGASALSGHVELHDGFRASFGKMETDTKGTCSAEVAVGKYTIETLEGNVTHLKAGFMHGSLCLFFIGWPDKLQFYGNVLSGLSKHIDIAVEACLSHAELDSSKRKLEGMYGLLEAVARTTELLLGTTDYMPALTEGLTAIGKATGVDRSYFFENKLTDSFDTSTTSQRVEWAATGIRPEIDNPHLQDVPFSASPEMMTALMKGDEFCEVIRLMPEGQSKEVLAMQDIQSILLLPVMVRQQCWGFVGFDDCQQEREWTSQERDVLRAFAGSLSRAIDRSLVQADLQRTQSELVALNASLEDRVKERTAELNEAIGSLQLAQEEMIRQEKLATIGQLVAGLAHELNTPLGAINASAGNLRSTLLEMFKRKIPATDMMQLAFTCSTADSVDLSHRLTTREERELTKDVREFLESRYPDAQNIPGIARTIAECGISPKVSPQIIDQLMGHPNSDALIELLVHMMRLRRAIATIGAGSSKATKVMRALKAYLHSGTEQHTAVNLQDNLNSVLTLYEHELKRGVTDEVRVPDSIWVKGIQDELSQVWSNIIGNAIQAMGYKGRLIISASADGDMAAVSISNNGPQIPEEHMPRLFDLMFTTKPLGQGTGLGLSIVKRVLDSHNGLIEVTSTPELTTFTIKIPLAYGAQK